MGKLTIELELKGQRVRCSVAGGIALVLDISTFSRVFNAESSLSCLIRYDSRRSLISSVSPRSPDEEAQPSIQTIQLSNSFT